MSRSLGVPRWAAADMFTVSSTMVPADRERAGQNTAVLTGKSGMRPVLGQLTEMIDQKRQ